MKPEDLPGARARMNCDRSEMLRVASTELRFASQTLRAEARELVATSGDICQRAGQVLAMLHLQRIAKKPTASPQAVHSLSTGLRLKT